MIGIPESGPEKIQHLLDSLGFEYKVVELPDTTRTAVDAANSIGCTLGQIVKSLVFQGEQTGKPILVVASGTNRVNERIIGEYIGEPIKKASAKSVKAITGFSIGGVPPLGHLQDILTFIDEDLLQYKEVWAAGGTSNSVFRLDPKDLQNMTGGKVVTI
ncbi:MAG: YbaK/EbsC family protein [Firmicutes bacterium]|nr:YbaK/EbsC family protein [Bacillota bacterium]